MMRNIYVGKQMFQQSLIEQKKKHPHGKRLKGKTQVAAVWNQAMERSDGSMRSVCGQSTNSAHASAIPPSTSKTTKQKRSKALTQEPEAFEASASAPASEASEGTIPIAPTRLRQALAAAKKRRLQSLNQ